MPTAGSCEQPGGEALLPGFDARSRRDGADRKGEAEANGDQHHFRQHVSEVAPARRDLAQQRGAPSKGQAAEKHESPRPDHGALQKHALSESGLDSYTADLLVQLMRAPGRRLRAVDLARGLLISTSSTTRLIDRAEAAGYVERQPDPDDRRAQQIVVTKEGERVALELAPRLLDVLHRVVFDPLTARERSVLTELLVRVRDAAREVGAEEP